MEAEFREYRRIAIVIILVLVIGIIVYTSTHDNYNHIEYEDLEQPMGPYSY